MKIILLLAAILLACSLKIDHEQSPIKVGGYEDLDLNNLPEDAQAVDAYLRKMHTNFGDVKLISAKRQVVAGFNYHYIYESQDKTEQWDIVVYKPLKGGLYENGFTYTKTLPNGEKVQAIGDPAFAFTGMLEPEPPKTTKVSSASPSSAPK
jgi:hypothetical protein